MSLGGNEEPAAAPAKEPKAEPKALGRWHLRNFQLLIGLTLLAVALLIGSLAIDAGLRSRNQLPSPPANQITVTGSAQLTVTSDTFEWDSKVSSTQPTTGAALFQLTGWIGQVQTALQGAGAHSDEITIGTVAVRPNQLLDSNGDPAGPVSSFTMSQTIKVRSARLAAEKPIVAITVPLLAAGVPFIAQQPQYTYTHLHHLRPILTAKARADAQKRARAALGNNATLGKSLSISVGQISVDAPGSVNIGSGDYDTSSVQKVVSVAVTATYQTS
jgi:hypothetical protein